MSQSAEFGEVLAMQKIQNQPFFQHLSPEGNDTSIEQEVVPDWSANGLLASGWTPCWNISGQAPDSCNPVTVDPHRPPVMGGSQMPPFMIGTPISPVMVGSDSTALNGDQPDPFARMTETTVMKAEIHEQADSMADGEAQTKPLVLAHSFPVSTAEKITGHTAAFKPDPPTADSISQPTGRKADQQVEDVIKARDELPIVRSNGYPKENEGVSLFAKTDNIRINIPPEAEGGQKTGEAAVQGHDSSEIADSPVKNRNQPDFPTTIIQAGTAPASETDRQLAVAPESWPPALAGDELTGDELAGQVTSTLLKERPNGETRLTVRLKPDEWGSLEVHLTRSTSGLVAKIQTDRPETCQLLRDRVPFIQESCQINGEAMRIEIQYQESASGGMAFGRDQAASERWSHAGEGSKPARSDDLDLHPVSKRMRPTPSIRPTNGRLIDWWA